MGAGFGGVLGGSASRRRAGRRNGAVIRYGVDGEGGSGVGPQFSTNPPKS